MSCQSFLRICSDVIGNEYNHFLFAPAAGRQKRPSAKGGRSHQLIGNAFMKCVSYISEQINNVNGVTSME